LPVSASMKPLQFQNKIANKNMREKVGAGLASKKI
jgi:hypothetical protein